jgi:hypothetical protein
MRITYAKHDLATSKLGQFASLAVVKGFSEFLKSHGAVFFKMMTRSERILGGRKKVVNILNSVPPLIASLQQLFHSISAKGRAGNDLCAAIGTHNSALRIRWPSSIGPGTSDEEVGDRTALKRATELHAWLERKASIFVSLVVK